MGIDERQLDEAVKELLPLGYARFRRNTGSSANPRLVKGVELVNTRKEWAISLFRNVNNQGNDVEIAIAPGRIATDCLTGAALKWLETVRGEFQHREHAPHHGSYKGDVFRIGLNLQEAKVFLRRFMAEVLKQPSQGPWITAEPGTAVSAVAAVKALPGGVEPVAPPSTPVSSTDERARSIAFMVAVAFAARDQSGVERIKTAKDKQVRFASTAHLQAHLEALWTSNCCVLSGLKLDMSGGDAELAPSLDRIDSSKHYEPGNLQVVARFINRWKSDDEQETFLRLLKLVKAVPTES